MAIGGELGVYRICHGRTAAVCNHKNKEQPDRQTISPAVTNKVTLGISIILPRIPPAIIGPDTKPFLGQFAPILMARLEELGRR
jgi:hypothetical protein